MWKIHFTGHKTPSIPLLVQQVVIVKYRPKKLSSFVPLTTSSAFCLLPASLVLQEAHDHLFPLLSLKVFTGPLIAWVNWKFSDLRLHYLKCPGQWTGFFGSLNKVSWDPPFTLGTKQARQCQQWSKASEGP